MNEEIIKAGLIAFSWGATWAACLQYTQWGRWLAQRRTWLTVVVGNGGTIASMTLFLDMALVASIVFVFFCAAIPIIARSFLNEFRDEAE